MPEVEAFLDYSPVTQLHPILCSPPEDHHWDPPSKPWGRAMRGVTYLGGTEME